MKKMRKVTAKKKSSITPSGIDIDDAPLILILLFRKANREGAPCRARSSELTNVDALSRPAWVSVGTPIGTDRAKRQQNATFYNVRKVFPTGMDQNPKSIFVWRCYL